MLASNLWLRSYLDQSTCDIMALDQRLRLIALPFIAKLAKADQEYSAPVSIQP